MEVFLQFYINKSIKENVVCDTIVAQLVCEWLNDSRGIDFRISAWHSIPYIVG